MNFIDEKLDQYVTEHSSPESAILHDLNRETHLKVLQPRMISGAYQGRVLSMLSKLIQPKYILEIGTYTGYSAICLAEGLVANGELHTLDINEERTDFVQKFVDEAGFNDCIFQHIGHALEVIPQLNKEWDLVFIDADKENYINYFNLLIPHLKSGCCILADNILWSGKVLDETADDLDTSTLKDFNQLIVNHPKLENVILPIRDGLQIARVI